MSGGMFDGLLPEPCPTCGARWSCVHDEPDYEPSDYDEDTCCDRCLGEGYFHDCGEDTCCCADPEGTELVTCPDCGGSGR